jgi:hypothetical protein
MTRQKNMEFPVGLPSLSQKYPSFNSGGNMNPTGGNLEYPLKTTTLQDD